MASSVPKFVKKEIVDTWAAESLYLMLLNNTLTFNPAIHQNISDISAKEITDTGGIYVAGGLALGNKSGNYDGSNAFLDADNPSIGPSANLNYRYGAVYKKTDNPATSPIRAVIDFVTDQIVTNGTSLIQWDTLGIIYLT